MRRLVSVAAGRRGWRIAVLAAALLATATPSWGQDTAAVPSAGAAAAVTAPQASGEELPATGISPLPPPATGRAYVHVFLAFGIAWALIFGYVVLLNRRIATAEREVGRLSQRGE